MRSGKNCRGRAGESAERWSYSSFTLFVPDSNRLQLPHWCTTRSQRSGEDTTSLRGITSTSSTALPVRLVRDPPRGSTARHGDDSPWPTWCLLQTVRRVTLVTAASELRDSLPQLSPLGSGFSKDQQIRGPHTLHQQGGFYDSRLQSRSLPITIRPIMPSDFGPLWPRGSKKSGFQKLPRELRDKIYGLSFLPRKPRHLMSYMGKLRHSRNDFFDYKQNPYYKKHLISAGLSNPTIRIRAMDGQPDGAQTGRSTCRTRKHFVVQPKSESGRPFKTTYHCVNNPGIEDKVGILGVNKQIHAEAAKVLYSFYTFDFDSHHDAMLAFLRDLTPVARSCIKSLRFVKPPTFGPENNDLANWAAALRYLTSDGSNISLRRLDLGIVTGLPGPRQWPNTPGYSAMDYELQREDSTMSKTMWAWLQHLLKIKGLETLNVEVEFEKTRSSVIPAKEIRKSRRFLTSIENGFTEFLEAKLLVPERIEQGRLGAVSLL